MLGKILLLTPVVLLISGCLSTVDDMIDTVLKVEKTVTVEETSTPADMDDVVILWESNIVDVVLFDDDSMAEFMLSSDMGDSDTVNREPMLPVISVEHSVDTVGVNVSRFADDLSDMRMLQVSDVMLDEFGVLNVGWGLAENPDFTVEGFSVIRKGVIVENVVLYDSFAEWDGTVIRLCVNDDSWLGFDDMVQCLTVNVEVGKVG